MPQLRLVHIAAVAALLLGAAAAPAPLLAQNVAGEWDLETTAEFRVVDETAFELGASNAPAVQMAKPGQKSAHECVFEGTSNIVQNGNQITGTSTLTLVSGPSACPAQMDAQLSGDVLMGVINMGMLMGGGLGDALFTGTVSGQNASGAFTVDSGPFTGVSGTWTAVLAVAATPIPAVETIGLLLLAALLLGSAMLLLGRQSA